MGSFDLYTKTLNRIIVSGFAKFETSIWLDFAKAPNRQ